VLFASLIWTTIEFFDFYIYATAAVLVFPSLFFPATDPASATLASLATFGIAFWLGIGSDYSVFSATVFGRKTTIGRRAVDHGVSTVAIGALPTYRTIALRRAVASGAMPLWPGPRPRSEWGRRGAPGD